MAVKITDDKTRMETLKGLIRDLHDGADSKDIQKRFTDLVGAISPEELSRMEQQLIEEGMPVEEVKRLCDVHVKVFKESLDSKPVPPTPPGHPVHTYMAENRVIEKRAREVESLLGRLTGESDAGTVSSLMGELRKELEEHRGLEVHYTRMENQLFPLLEKHGVSGPSNVMWSLHDDIRANFKGQLKKLGTASPADKDEVASDAASLLENVKSMVTKEEKVLFQTALKLLSDDDWGRVRHGEDEIGYYGIDVPPQFPAAGGAIPETVVSSGALKVSTGELSLEQLDLMLTHIPVDMTFVDEEDIVRYYSAGKTRIFVRTPAVIGRSIQMCHPPASVDRVQRILDDFRDGKRDEASFWLNMEDMLIYIRYFAIRDANGIYRGCLEVTQDIAPIQEIKGERRLLDDGKE